MTGLQLTQEVRKRKILTPIIVLSADVRNAHAKTACQMVQIFFINKPASNEKLANALNEVTKGV